MNPLVRCGQADSLFVGEYEGLQANIQSFIDAEESSGHIATASIYFRDMYAGPWFGVNEHNTFIPASLFKVPLMIAVLKQAQDSPNLLSQKVEYSGSALAMPNVEGSEKTVIPGHVYTVNDLLYKMIVYSDNASTDVLQGMMNQLDPSGNVLKKIFTDLGMERTYQTGQLTAQSYAALFRILYNARFLSLPLSQKALNLLSHSDYHDGLVAGVPHDIPVAHKFGVHNVSGDAVKQFHDCGIVYYPRRPYILCIMTTGHDIDKAVMFTAEISRRVYAGVDARVSASANPSAGDSK